MLHHVVVLLKYIFFSLIFLKDHLLDLKIGQFSNFSDIQSILDYN